MAGKVEDGAVRNSDVRSLGGPRAEPPERELTCLFDQKTQGGNKICVAGADRRPPWQLAAIAYGASVKGPIKGRRQATGGSTPKGS